MTNPPNVDASSLADSPDSDRDRCEDGDGPAGDDAPSWPADLSAPTGEGVGEELAVGFEGLRGVLGG